MPINRKETADFICQLTSELAALAREAEFKSLGYILELARHEATHAGETATVTPPPRRSVRKPKRTAMRRRAA
jgi:hypothetical protein